jgi:hypothetical protein
VRVSTRHRRFGLVAEGSGVCCLGYQSGPVPSKQSSSFGADDRPACPSCGKPMHPIRRGPHPDHAQNTKSKFFSAPHVSMRKYEAQTCPDAHTHSSRLERRYGRPECPLLTQSYGRGCPLRTDSGHCLVAKTRRRCDFR